MTADPTARSAGRIAATERVQSRRRRTREDDRACVAGRRTVDASRSGRRARSTTASAPRRASSRSTVDRHGELHRRTATPGGTRASPTAPDGGDRTVDVVATPRSSAVRPSRDASRQDIPIGTRRSSPHAAMSSRLPPVRTRGISPSVLLCIASYGPINTLLSRRTLRAECARGTRPRTATRSRPPRRSGSSSPKPGARWARPGA